MLVTDSIKQWFTTFQLWFVSAGSLYIVGAVRLFIELGTGTGTKDELLPPPVETFAVYMTAYFVAAFQIACTEVIKDPATSWCVGFVGIVMGLWALVLRFKYRDFDHDWVLMEPISILLIFPSTILVAMWACGRRRSASPGPESLRVPLGTGTGTDPGSLDASL